MTINVGLSRKIGEPGFSSRGASVNVEMEADSSLVNDPAKLKDRIRQLFVLVRSSLDEELANGNGNGHADSKPEPAGNGNGHAQQGSPPRMATQSQVKAIHSIAKARKLDLPSIIWQRFHIAKPEDLSIKQASELIDHIKNGS
jgi:hypothetical protein